MTGTGWRLALRRPSTGMMVCCALGVLGHVAGIQRGTQSGFAPVPPGAVGRRKRTGFGCASWRRNACASDGRGIQIILICLIRRKDFEIELHAQVRGGWDSVGRLTIAGCLGEVQAPGTGLLVLWPHWEELPITSAVLRCWKGSSLGASGGARSLARPIGGGWLSL
jgi:hypothetical protein